MKNNKNIYAAPEAELFLLDSVDVITTSLTPEEEFNDDNTFGNGWLPVGGSGKSATFQ